MQPPLDLFNLCFFAIFLLSSLQNLEVFHMFARNRQQPTGNKLELPHLPMLLEVWP